MSLRKFLRTAAGGGIRLVRQDGAGQRVDSAGSRRRIANGRARRRQGAARGHSRCHEPGHHSAQAGVPSVKIHPRQRIGGFQSGAGRDVAGSAGRDELPDGSRQS